MIDPATGFYLEIPMSLCININDRDHWAVKARKSKQLRQLGHHHAMENTNKGMLKWFAPDERVHVTVTFIWPDYRRRDVHNWMPTVKAIIDGIVDAGLLKDDSDKYLSGPDLRIGNRAEWAISRTPKHIGLFFNFGKEL